MIKYLTMTIEKQKNIALIAHDGKKQDMLKWCMDNKEILQQHNLSGTGTTARMIADHVGLKIKGYNSGPLGGDQQIGAKIVEGNIDMVIFFSDPLEAQPYDPDVKALLRIAQRIYYFDKKYYVLTGIGTNGFIVTAYPIEYGG